MISNPIRDGKEKPPGAPQPGGGVRVSPRAHRPGQCDRHVRRRHTMGHTVARIPCTHCIRPVHRRAPPAYSLHSTRAPARSSRVLIAFDPCTGAVLRRTHCVRLVRRRAPPAYSLRSTRAPARSSRVLIAFDSCTGALDLLVSGTSWGPQAGGLVHGSIALARSSHTTRAREQRGRPVIPYHSCTRATRSLGHAMQLIHGSRI
jgi:hypothetical protein